MLPNPIDTSRFQPYGSGTTRRPLHLLYVGRLHPEKGVDLLLRAFRRLCDDVRGCTLQVVGPHRPEEGGGGEAYRAALHRLAADLPVEFTGPVYDVEQLAALYRGAQVFCYPSLADRGEAFGVAALEAMACGAVPVVSDLACFRDFVVPGETGLVFDHRAEDAPQRLAATLERALGDTRLSTAMRNRGVAAARDFGFDEVAARYEAFFYSVLEQRNGVTRT